MLQKNFLRYIAVVGSVSFVLTSYAGASPALAGFQWVSPNESEAVESYPPPVEQSQRAVSPYVPVPKIIEAPVSSAPSAAPLSKKIEQPVVAEVEQKMVKGFGNNLPLSVALRQVLPAEMGFSVDPSVSLGTQVSWKGGAPWGAVLADMLRPAKLEMRMQGGIVQIYPSVGASAGDVPSGYSSGAQPMGASVGTKKSEPFASVAEVQPSYLTPPAGDAPPSEVKVRKPVVPQSLLVSPTNELPPASRPSAPVSLGASGTFVDMWSAEKGDTLHKVLESWSRRANVELAWQAEYDFPLQASVSLGGTFEDAVRNLLLGFENAKPQPIGSIHNSHTAGQTVLVIETRGNKYSD